MQPFGFPRPRVADTADYKLPARVYAVRVKCLLANVSLT
jgi:hypothetical protein